MTQLLFDMVRYDEDLGGRVRIAMGRQTGDKCVLIEAGGIQMEFVGDTNIRLLMPLLQRTLNDFMTCQSGEVNLRSSAPKRF